MVFLIWKMCLIWTIYKCCYPSWCGCRNHNYLITEGGNLLPCYFLYFSYIYLCKRYLCDYSLFFVLRWCEFWPFGLVFYVPYSRKLFNCVNKRFPVWFCWSLCRLNTLNFPSRVKEYVKHPFWVDFPSLNPENAAVCRKSTGSKFALIHDAVVN